MAETEPLPPTGTLPRVHFVAEETRLGDSTQSAARTRDVALRAEAITLTAAAMEQQFNRTYMFWCITVESRFKP